MTYYEEFGISSSATPDEIRHAHRRLVKILHPDLQTEERTRKLAEIHTRRINAIAQILLHSEYRKDYDAGLLPHADDHRPPRGKHSYSPVVFAAAITCLLAGLWFIPTATDRSPGTPLPSASSIKDTNSPKPGKAPTNHPVKAAVPPPQLSGSTSSEATTQTTDPIPEETPDIAFEPLHPASDPIERAPAAKPAPEPAAQTHQPAPLSSATDSPLIGTWIYVPAPTAEENRKLYRPEYIEMRIRSIPGAIEGQYRARYHVPDRPLSPNVGFRFAGPPGIGSTAFRWNGSNGLAGQVELKLMTANSIQVIWRVTELAESADLVSGTAILTRVQ